MRYIKLSEGIINWEWFTDGNMLKLWVYLLVNAQQFEDTRYKGIELKTGQLVTGRKKISQETGLTEMQVRTCLNKLKSTNEITIETTNKYSVITILKYDLYQSNEPYGNQQINQENNQQITNEQPTNNQQITTSNKDKRDKKEREKDIYNKALDCSPEFAEALSAFEEMRKKIRKPLTEKAKQMILDKLSKMAMDEETQIKILNQSTMNSWQGVFPLSEDRGEKKGSSALQELYDETRNNEMFELY